jgi:hypothetical protein
LKEVEKAKSLWLEGGARRGETNPAPRYRPIITKSHWRGQAPNLQTNGYHEALHRKFLTDDMYFIPIPLLSRLLSIPIRFLYGTAAEINFLDVVSIARTKARANLTHPAQELVAQTGLTRQMIGRLRQQALAAGDLYEDSPCTTGGASCCASPPTST